MVVVVVRRKLIRRWLELSDRDFCLADGGLRLAWRFGVRAWVCRKGNHVGGLRAHAGELAVDSLIRP